jgi:hypothetical protein
MIELDDNKSLFSHVSFRQDKIGIQDIEKF